MEILMTCQTWQRVTQIWIDKNTLLSALTSTTPPKLRLQGMHCIFGLICGGIADHSVFQRATFRNIYSRI